MWFTIFEAATAETQHLPQVRMLVDYLVISGLVERDAGMLKLKNGSQPEAGAAAEPAATGTAPPRPRG